MKKPRIDDRTQRCRRCIWWVGHCAYDGIYGCVFEEAPTNLMNRYKGPQDYEEEEED